MQIAALFGSSTLWQMARSRGAAGSYEEVLDASDVATLYAVLGLMAESGSEAFVIPNGRPGRSLSAPRRN